MRQGLVELLSRLARVAVLALPLLLAWSTAWRGGRDSALYRDVGVALARGEGYARHGEPERLAYPGWPLVLAAVDGGADPLRPIGALLFAVALAGVALAASFAWARALAGEAAAWWVAAAMAWGPLLAASTYALGNDVAFLAAMATAWWARARLDAAAGEREAWRRTAVIAAAILVALLAARLLRPAFWPLAAAWLVGELLGRGGRPARGWSLAALAVAVVAGGAIDAAVRPVWPWDDGYAAALGGRLAAHDGDALLRDLRGTAVALGEGFAGVALAAPLALVAAVGLARRAPRAALAVAATVAAMLISGARPRYLLPVAPLLALGWWWAVSDLVARAAAGRPPPGLRPALLALPVLLALPALAAFVVDQRAGDAAGEVRRDAAAAAVVAGLPAASVVLTAEPRRVSFLAGRRVFGPCERPAPPTHVVRGGRVEPATRVVAPPPGSPCWMWYGVLGPDR